MLGRRRVGIDRRLGGDQVLVVQERTAERPLEEVVGDHIVRVAFRMEPLVDGQSLRVVLAHGQPDRVAADHVAVLCAAVQLVLLLVELVHQVACAAARQAGAVQHLVREGERTQRRQARRRRRRNDRVDHEPRVAEAAREAVRIRAGARDGCQVDVVLLQAVVRMTLLVDLRRLRIGRVFAAVDAFPASVEIVETVVFLVDDEDVVDLVERCLACARLGRPCGRCRDDRRDADGGKDGADACKSLHGVSPGSRTAGS